MSGFRLVLSEAGREFRAGLRSGIVGLVALGLAGYLLVSLTSADYVQKMGAADIARNAPSLVYLMSTGCMFFLFCAWAWVFAQPVLRDRQAGLQEEVLSMPVSLTALLWGRFIGAVLIGNLLAGALIVAFLAVPLLTLLSVVPHGVIMSPPWAALLFAWLALLAPAGTGIGALYFLVTLRSRSVAAAFALSAIMVLLWMFSVVVLNGAHIAPRLAAIMDPSLFTYALTNVETWTPWQKEHALLPVTVPFLLNRLLWGVLPLLLLALMIGRVRREELLLERPPGGRLKQRTRGRSLASGPTLAPVADLPVAWGRLMLREAGWQLGNIVRGRGFRIGVAVLLAMGLFSGFVHGVWHAEGPMIPRPEFVLPLLASAMFLIIVFIVAAMAGMVWRRDDVQGFDAMLDATPAPAWVRPLGRALALGLAILGVALLPGVAGMMITAFIAPTSFTLETPFLYAVLVTAPPLLELGLIALLLHACVKRAGIAYAFSMLLTFFLVLNHELGLVNYPPFEIGIPASLSLSGITGWRPWIGYLLALDGYKMALCAVITALVATCATRGAESRFTTLRQRVDGPVAVLIGGGVLVMVGLVYMLHQQLITSGDYIEAGTLDSENALWEQRWLRTAGRYQVAGGRVAIDVETASGRLSGDWTMQGVRASGGMLHAELPQGFVLSSVEVDHKPVKVDLLLNHLAIPLGDGNATHEIRLRWNLPAPGWSSDGVPPWRGHGSVWLMSSWAMPRLGLDPSRILRAPAVRRAHGLAPDPVLPDGTTSVAAEAVAPVGFWQWAVTRDGVLSASSGEGAPAPLSFALASLSTIKTTTIGDLRLLHDTTREGAAQGVAVDVDAMRRCVARRVGTNMPVDTVVQWPRGLENGGLAGKTLLLPEAPYWDVADRGAGRSLRRAYVATALARHALIEASSLRKGPGSAWWQVAVPGAVGLLCLGDVDGLHSLQTVLALKADQVPKALASAAAPVGELAQADATGWVDAYAPLAALVWTARQSPADIADISHRIAEGVPVEQAVGKHMSDAERQAAFGPPRAVDLAMEPDGKPAARLRLWKASGWISLKRPPDLLVLQQRGDGIDAVPADAAIGGEGIYVTSEPSYQRFPNLQHFSTGR